MVDCQFCNINHYYSSNKDPHSIKECSDYLGILAKTICPFCEVNLTSSSDMMLHLRYKHFNLQHSTTIFEPSIKIEPGVITEPNKIKLPGVPCKKCSKFISNKSMKSNENGLCRRCTNSNEPKVEESHDTEMEMNQEQDIDDIPDLDEDMEKDSNGKFQIRTLIYNLFLTTNNALGYKNIYVILDIGLYEL